MNEFDISIIGGGVAGQTLALQLKKQMPKSKIVILERASFPIPDAPIKVGESTVEISSHYFAEVLGYRNHLEKKQLPKLGLRYFSPHSGQNDITKRFELGSNTFFPRKTYQIDRQRFEVFLYQECKKKKITFRDDAYIRDVKLSPENEPHLISYVKDKEKFDIKSKWIIDASGRASVLQSKLNLKVESKHNINAVWFRIKSKINIDDWSDNKKWKAENSKPGKSRWFSTNHLMGEGYWVWLIPLSRGSTSVGIVADPRFHPLSEMNSFDKAVKWLEKHEPQCAKAVVKEKAKLEDFLALKKFSKCSSQVYSQDRWALTGDAGIFIDPLYSPGMDFVAYSNTFITDFVTRESKGKRVNSLIKIYNDLFISLTENTFQVYQDNYAVLKNPQLTTVKIIWDFAVYWAFIAFLFNHEKSCDISLLGRFSEDLKLVTSLHHRMQEFFREWNKLKSPVLERKFVDLSKVKLLMDLNKSLMKKFSDAKFDQKLSANIQMLQDLGQEIFATVGKNYPALSKKVKLDKKLKNKNYLKSVFKLLDMKI